MDVGRFSIDAPPVFDIRAFRRRLLAWYKEHGRDLPWRHTRDPYTVLVSEVMLQQTQVATVIPYYHAWLRRFPNFAALAGAAESEVLHAWQGLGYYARARNLHAAAKAVIAQHGGGFPNTTSEARKLPGLGRYTANAVATFAFDQSVPIIEANTARLLARLFDLQIPIDSGAGREKLWEFAAELLPKREARKYNSALMDLGALVCVSRIPKCAICPVRGFCRASTPATLPIKRARTATKQLVERHAFVFRQGHVFLEQSAQRWRGMWILPRFESLKESAELIHSAQFPFTHHQITLEVYRGFAQPMRISPQQSWFTFGQTRALPMPSPHRRAVDAIFLSQVQAADN